MPSKSTLLARANPKYYPLLPFFFLNNTSMYEKHISWKQWSSLKTYSTFHKPNKPAPARARKRKVGWHGKLIEMYWKGYLEYLHTYTSQGYRGLKLCKNHFPRVYKNVLLVISTLTHRGRKQTNHRRVNRLVLVVKLLTFLFCSFRWGSECRFPGVSALPVSRHTFKAQNGTPGTERTLCRKRTAAKKSNRNFHS